MYWYKYLYYPTYTRLDGLLVGVSIAGFYQFSPKVWGRISQYGNLLLVASLAILSFAYFLCEDQTTFNASVFGFPIIALGYGLMVAGAISPNSFLYRTKSMVTSQLASLSYGLYLTHKGIIHITHQMLSKYISNPNLMLVISTITCIVFAYFLQILIEKPFMRLRNRVL
jgi:peptidoglycan/LPS O-acetylase OafA/YrhL